MTRLLTLFAALAAAAMAVSSACVASTQLEASFGLPPAPELGSVRVYFPTRFTVLAASSLDLVPLVS